MSVVVPDEILQASQLSPSEFRQEIALHLFQTGRLTLGSATPCLSSTSQAVQHSPPSL